MGMMLDYFQDILFGVGGILWGPPMIIFGIGVAIYEVVSWVKRKRSK